MRCSDNSCGDCDWCGRQEDDDAETVKQTEPDPPDEDVDLDDRWVDYL
jgi:hypothetical protein